MEETGCFISSEIDAVIASEQGLSDPYMEAVSMKIGERI